MKPISALRKTIWMASSRYINGRSGLASLSCNALAVSLLSVALYVGSGSAQVAKGDIPKIPKVTLIYPAAGTIFDRTSGSFLKEGGANKEMIAEAAELRPRLQTEWDNDGRKYLEIVLQRIGAPFPYGEVQATLTVSPVDTMSMPLLINVSRFLRRSDIHPPSGDFSERLFHELMHHYVAIVHGSPLQKKYATESPTTLYHLHVMALERLVLTSLGKTEELKFLDNGYKTRDASGHYRRAWEIVSDIEGPEPFIRELQNAAKSQHGNS
jgi:hypothetical protein